MSERERKTSDKEQENVFVAGKKPVTELLTNRPKEVDLVYFRVGQNDAETERLIELCKNSRILYRFIDTKKFDTFYRGNHQYVLAKLAGLTYKPLEELVEAAFDAPLPVIVVLDRVQDTGNVGAIARTLYALGVAGLVVAKHEGAYLGSGAIRASAGALSMLPVAKVTNIAQAIDYCKKQGFTIYGAQKSEYSENIYEAKFQKPLVLVLGNEENGIREGVIKRLDFSLHIPFHREFDSLNVAQAGSICISCIQRQYLEDKE